VRWACRYPEDGADQTGDPLASSRIVHLSQRQTQSSYVDTAMTRRLPDANPGKVSHGARESTKVILRLLKIHNPL
jgi:hypothetical protein